jgi:hypothetical protein
MATKLAGAMAVLVAGIAVGALMGPGLGGTGSETALAGVPDETKVVVSKDFDVPGAQNMNGGNVFCPDGYEAIGGGVETGNFYTLDVTLSSPIFGPRDDFKTALQKGKGQYSAATGWRGYANNEDDETRPIKVSVVCTRK